MQSRRADVSIYKNKLYKKEAFGPAVVLMFPLLS